MFADPNHVQCIFFVTYINCTYWWDVWNVMSLEWLTSDAGECPGCHVPWLEWLLMEGSAQERGHSLQTLGLCETKAFLYPCYWLPRRAGARFNRNFLAWVLAWKFAWFLAWDSLQNVTHDVRKIFLVLPHHVTYRNQLTMYLLSAFWGPLLYRRHMCMPYTRKGQ